MLLYRLLTGSLPQPDRPRVAAPLDAVVAKALSKDTADRYQSATEMDADLARSLEGKPVLAKQRKRVGSVIAGVLVIFLAGLLGWRLLRPAQRDRTFVPFDAGAPNAMQPALSADGKWLAFASPGERFTRPDIWLKPMPKGAARRLTNGDSWNDEPSLSPGGEWVAFHSTGPPAGVYLQPAVGGRARLVVAGGRSPRFSPDGKWIAYLNTSETGGDVLAANTRWLYRIPAQGGNPLRLARNASSVQGAAWTADSGNLLFLAIAERGAMRLWRAPLDGGAAEVIPEFRAPYLNGRACGVTGDRFLYTAADRFPVLGEFLLKPVAGGRRYSAAVTPSKLEILGCTASAAGMILADEADNRSSAWTLPIDAESATIRGSLAPLTELEHGDFNAEFTPDGTSFLASQADESYMQDYRTGARRRLPFSERLSSDGLFVLLRRPTTPGVLSLKTGMSWGRLEVAGVSWDLSSGGEWLLTVGAEVRRSITAWNTHNSEHRTIYASAGANLYLAGFAQDGRWVVFTSEESGRAPHMWAAPFRGLQSVPEAEWVDLGEGDYPRWSPGGGRIYFTQVHDGFECIFTRALDPVTKRPAGPVAVVQHFHDRLTPRGMRPGAFRISVAQDKLAFGLGERAHRLLEWR